MMLSGKRVLVTGGAGFIGSGMCARLLKKGCGVVCFDNFSSGKEEFIAGIMKNPKFTLVRGDMVKPSELRKALKGCETVIHLAANPDVRLGESDSHVHFEQNVVATFNLLEAMKDLKVKELAFASSSVVYGSAKTIPTPEGYGPLLPISLYGASKLACEALISAYSDNFGITSVMFRFANIIGKHAHGVTRDFKRKLEADPSSLEILGDGSQTKSYLHLDDCLDASILAIEKTEKGVEPYNIGSDDKLNVKTIAEIVSSEMGLKPSYRFTGGTAWAGDIKIMLLATEKIRAFGWNPKLNSEQAVRKAVRQMLDKE